MAGSHICEPAFVRLSQSGVAGASRRMCQLIGSVVWTVASSTADVRRVNANVH